MTALHVIIDSWIAFMWRLAGQPDTSGQVGQGRKVRPQIGDTTVVWMLIVADVGALWGCGWLAAAGWRAFHG